MTHQLTPDIRDAAVLEARTSAAGMREREAAAYIGVKPKTLANWRSAGKGPRYYRLGRTIVYRRDDLDQYFEEHLQAPQPA